MNPVRMRIVQYFMLHETGTPAEILKELSDIPSASLYRHLKILLEHNCIKIVKEEKIRGTVRKTYALVPNPMGEVTQGDVESFIQNTLFSLMTSFKKYFLREDADPMRDFLSLSTSTLMLSDKEFIEVTRQIGEILNHVITNRPDENRKPRRFTLISSPCEE